MAKLLASNQITSVRFRVSAPNHLVIRKIRLSVNPEDYIHVVKAIARHMKRTLPPQVDLEDLESAGYFGLLDAAKRYDPRRKTKFETFCMRRIRGAIYDELRKLDWVPRLVRQRGEEAVTMKSFSELTSRLTSGEKEDNEEFIVEDPSGNICDKVDLKIQLNAAINSLKPRYKQAIELYYLKGLTLKQASRFMGVTESRVCQTLKATLPILRKYLEQN